MTPLYNFRTDTADGWFIVNDGVMGGHSDGHVARNGDALVFLGTLVTRDGGFSAARTDKTADLSGTGAVELVVRGDGRTYRLELSDGVYRRGEMVSRTAPFQTTGEQQTVRVAYADLDATVFGEPVRVPTFDPSTLAGVGIFIAGRPRRPVPACSRVDACREELSRCPRNGRKAAAPGESAHLNRRAIQRDR